jgi:hypothetical protein
VRAAIRRWGVLADRRKHAMSYAILPPSGQTR